MCLDFEFTCNDISTKNTYPFDNSKVGYFPILKIPMNIENLTTSQILILVEA